MHPIREISTHQAFPTTAERLEIPAARHEDIASIGVSIEEALEQRFPLIKFVNFVDHDEGLLVAKLVEASLASDIGCSTEKDDTVVWNIPVQIGRVTAFTFKIAQKMVKLPEQFADVDVGAP